VRARLGNPAPPEAARKAFASRGAISVPAQSAVETLC